MFIAICPVAVTCDRSVLLLDQIMWRIYFLCLLTRFNRTIKRFLHRFKDFKLHLLTTQFTDNSKAADPEEFHNAFFSDLFLILRVNYSENLPQNLAMITLVLVEIEHRFEKKSRLPHCEPSVAIHVVLIENFFYILDAYGDVSLLLSLQASLIVIKNHGQQNTS